MASYFRVFHVPIAIDTDTIDNLVASACILHNMLRDGNVLAPQQNVIDDDHDQ